ncbi:MAG: acetyltransferase, family [Labilithrix sp.]|nr:acetyltransferase, family [Labilithrix sp.]
MSARAAAMDLAWKRAAARRVGDGQEMWRDDSRVYERPGLRGMITPSSKLGFNEINATDLGDEAIEAAIDQVVADFGALGVLTKWYVAPGDRPATLEERLVRRGYEPVAVRAMGAGTTLDLGAPSSRVTAEAIGEAELEPYLAVNAEGWGIGEAELAAERAAHLRELRKPRPTAYFVAAKLDGELIGTAGLFLREGFGYLVGGQVLAAARGQGAYRALTAARLGLLHQLGLPYAITLAREATAAPLLEHLGFETLHAAQCFLLRFDRAT